MLLDTKHLLVAFIGLTSHVALAQVGYASLNGGIPVSGPTVTITTCSALKSAVAGSSPQIVRVSGTLVGCGVMDVASDKFIVGVGSTAVLNQAGFRIKEQSRVIIRNIKFKPPPPEADAITIEASTNVWIDHCHFESDLDHDKDYYDGLIDITHGADLITVSWCKFLNHWKASLVGHSDDNGDEDTGKLRVTYHHNYWNNINSRTPSYRFGTGHIFSSCYLNILESGINARMGAILKIEQCYFQDAAYCIATDLYSSDPGYVQLSGNVIDPSTTTTSINHYSSLSIPYAYTLTSASQVCTLTVANAGVGVVTTIP